MSNAADLDRLRVNMRSQNATRVGGLADVVRTLQAQGAAVTLEDMQPMLLGLNGYVGTKVKFRNDRVERIWVRGLDVIQAGSAPQKADLAEWLTMTLADPQTPLVSVEAVIREYLKMDICQGWPPMLRAALLSHAATNMGFLYDPLATKLWLPHDHPMAQKIILPSDYEVQRYGATNPVRRPPVRRR